MKQIAVTFRHADGIKKVDYIFQAWLKTVEFSNPNTVSVIYNEWQQDRVRLILNENDYYNSIDNSRKGCELCSKILQ